VLPSFRQRLLRGKTINRFSAFVTSGAEEWVLNGAPTPEDESAISTPISHGRFSTTDSVAEDIRLNKLGIGEADRHFVDEGPAWQPKIPGFRVLVHSPSKRSSGLSGAYTVYNVTSLVQPSEHNNPDDAAIRSASPGYITVQRRFSHFVVLHTALLKRLPGIALPPLPEKQYAGRFNAAFVEARRGDLERYLDRIVRHPIARYTEVVTSFLGCEDDLVSGPLARGGVQEPAQYPSYSSLQGMETADATILVDACCWTILLCARFPPSIQFRHPGCFRGD
jgi:sorting nexin-9/18/33